MKRCGWGISWDHQYRIYAVRLEMQSSGGLRLLSYTSDTLGNQSFEQRLKSIIESIQVEDEEFLALCGYLPECVVVERRLPPLTGKDLEDALEYELSELFPAQNSEISYTYRIIPSEDPNSCRVRIMGIHNGKLNMLLEHLREAGVRGDVLWHPFLAIDTELDSSEIYLPFVEPDCVLRPAVNGVRGVAMLSSYTTPPAITHLSDLTKGLHLAEDEFPLSGAYPSAVLAAGCLLHNADLKDFGTHLLPDDLRRMRYRKLRHGIIYLGLLALTCLLVLLGKIWYQERDLVAETSAMIIEANEKLEEVRERSQLVARRQLVMKKFTENMVDTEMLSFLYRLTSVLPDNMYVTNFSVIGSRISVTIVFTGERMVLLELLSTISNYKLSEDTKITLNSDNKTSTAQAVWVRTDGSAK